MGAAGAVFAVAISCDPDAGTVLTGDGVSDCKFTAAVCVGEAAPVVAAGRLPVDETTGPFGDGGDDGSAMDFIGATADCLPGAVLGAGSVEGVVGNAGSGGDA